MYRNQLAEMLPNLFGELDENTIDNIEAEAEWVHVSRGDVLIKQGDPGDSMYILIRGRLQARVTDEDGNQIVEEDNTDHRLKFGMSYRPDPRLSLGTNFTYRLDRRWDYTYFGGGSERDLTSRNVHRNLVTTLDYLPDGYTGVKARFSRSKQRSGTFDDLTITLSRTL